MGTNATDALPGCPTVNAEYAAADATNVSATTDAATTIWAIRAAVRPATIRQLPSAASIWAAAIRARRWTVHDGLQQFVCWWMASMRQEDLTIRRMKHFSRGYVLRTSCILLVKTCKWLDACGW